jgi:SAM-dependent methyltransferase
MNKVIKEIISPFRKFIYQVRGGTPWSYGYLDKRWELIYNIIRDESALDRFAHSKTPDGYGIGFDERTVEYPWIFSKLGMITGKKILDAGSTFNYPQVISHPVLKGNEVSIYTFYPEYNNFIKDRISYQFGDLRQLPYRDSWFDHVICQSTIEHVDMDNSIYGYELEKAEDVAVKSYEYMKVVEELIRVLKPGGKLLLTFPYGRFKNYGFFQQFDKEMAQHIFKRLCSAGRMQDYYMLYSQNGWTFVSSEECQDSLSYNPHTGEDKGNDGAAHCRCVCCIEFLKL